jgi:VIT1/CCC1 family predicted Fe2+/Mn2+ transporter
MSEAGKRERLLEPIERVSEALFGLIMVLTFTGTLSIAADRAEVAAMLIGALGCNFAWGMIDGIFYLMGTLAEKGRHVLILHAVRSAANPEEGRRALAHGLPEAVANAITPAELESLRARLVSAANLPDQARLAGRDWAAAAAVFAWVFVVTFPVAIPFMFIDDPDRALRVSNGVAVAMLCVVGYAYGKCIGRNPWTTAALTVVCGAVIVAATIALGG